MAPDLSIIIVNWNMRDVLRACLESVVRESVGINYEVIVVDNASTDGSLEMLSAEFAQVSVVRNDKNLGFAAANNNGIAKATGRYVLLLNPDTEVLDGALQKTVAFMDSRPDASIVGCTLHYPGGVIQESVRSFPSLLNVFFESTFLYLLLPRSKTVGRYYMTFFDYRSTQRVDWLSGAFLMIRKEVFGSVGVLDEQFFMYSEELDFCYRAQIAGYASWFFHEAHVIHHWGGPKIASRSLMLWTHKSQVMFFRKHFTGFEKRLLVALKLAGLALRIPVYAIAGVILFNRRLLEKTRLLSYALRHAAD